jgi:hypothetical protein
MKPAMTSAPAPACRRTARQRRVLLLIQINEANGALPTCASRELGPRVGRPPPKPRARRRCIRRP